MQEHLGWLVQTIHALTVPTRGLLVPEGEEVDREALFPSGFRPQPGRWMRKGSCFWITRWRRLCRDHEGLPQSREAFITRSARFHILTTCAPAFPS